MQLDTICVYCGSNPGNDPVYAEQARALGREMAALGLGLVYGGARVGLMGVVADTVLEAGGKVIGVIPQSLVNKELAHPNLTELHVVQSMHERKTMMADRASAFIAMPGGVGTLEEIFETWTWAQLGFHQKPCGLFNVAGYYDRLAEFLDHTVASAFMQPQHRQMLAVDDNPATLLDHFAAYQPPTVSKWIASPAKA